MFSNEKCAGCGEPINHNYELCYICHAKKRGNQYKQEVIPGHKSQDKNRGRIYQTYVLDTDYGHYVGHSGNLKKRVGQHQHNRVVSTSGGRAKLVWQSEPFKSRFCASGYESALKAFRDFEEPKFKVETGLDPKPFKSPNKRLWLRKGRRAGGLDKTTLVITVALLIAILILSIGAI